MKKDLYNLIDDFPEFEDLITSKQFEFSEKLIQKRIYLGLSFNELATIAGYTPEEYIAFEYGDQSIKVNKYEEVIRKIDNYINNEESGVVENNDIYQSTFKETYSNQSNTDFNSFDLQKLEWVA